MLPWDGGSFQGSRHYPSPFPHQTQQQMDKNCIPYDTMSFPLLSLTHSYQQAAAASTSLTGRSGVLLYIKCDNESLSQYQCTVRKQIEVFEAGHEDVQTNAQGRNKPIVLGQVGIRCRHCAMLPVQQRARAAVYYPSKLTGVYQAAQNMASHHFLLENGCQHIPDIVRNDLMSFDPKKRRKSSSGGGKIYWANALSAQGVYEDENVLRFEAVPVTAPPDVLESNGP